MTITLILPNTPEGDLVAANQALLREPVRVMAVKAAVADRILAVAPLHTQQNLSSHRIDVMARRMAGETISQEDANLEAQAVEVAKKIAAIRKAGSAAIEGGAQPNQVIWPE